MPEFCCSLCSLTSGSEVGVKVHYSKLHLNGSHNRGDDSMKFEDDKLFQICDVFGQDE